MNVDKASDYQNEIARLKAALLQSEEDGAELADRAGRKIDQLENEIKTLEASRGIDGECNACERKRRIFAGMMGVWLAIFWHDIVARHYPGSLLIALMFPLGAAPYLFVFYRWHSKRFIAKHHWVTWQDNDLLRLYQARWNAFVEGLMVR